MKTTERIITMVLLMGCCSLSQGNAADKPWRVVPHGFTGLQVMQGEDVLFEMNSEVVGPDGATPNWKEQPRVVAPGRRVHTETLRTWTEAKGKAKPAAMAPVDFQYEVSAPTADSIELLYRCAAGTDSKLTGVSLVAPYGDFLARFRIRAKLADGAAREFLLPMSERDTLGLQVSSVTLSAANSPVITFQFDKPLVVDVQRQQLRIWPVSGDLKANQAVEGKVTVRFDRPVAFEPQNQLVNMADWYPVEVESDHRPGSAIGMEEWLDRPAGKHGWLKMDGDRFVFADGTPQKFWGIGICVGLVAPPQETADLWADRCAKYGANLVRMHKFYRHAASFGKNGSGISDEADSLKFNEEAARRWDYFNAALAKRGVYTGWSAYYAFKLTPADRDRVLAYDEIMAARHGAGWFHETTIGLVNFAPDLQDLHIQAMVNKLNRVNTVTGRRYADDMSLAYIELQNEDDIFFPQVAGRIKETPTYQAYINGEFSDWLKARHDSLEALRESWGDDLGKSESFEARNIEAFHACLGAEPPSRRAIETYRFLFERQDAYYQRMVKAIRETGYQGGIVGSCWQAATWLGHLWNMYSDYRVGFIDRHNYARTQPMLRRPGTGLLSAGMQAMADRPFALSEWAGQSILGSGDQTAFIGIYGMGLQGWDLSAQFASSTPLIERLDGSVPRLGVCDKIVNIAQYPAIARMLYRGDIEQGEIVVKRRVSLPALAKGDVGFNERFSLLGGANIKEFSSVAPMAALAAGRVVLEFVDGPVEQPVWQNVAPWLDAEARIARSTNNQLKWDYSGKGFFTVDTPGTQGVIGFGGGRTHRLAQVTIEQQSAYGLIYVSARQRDRALKDADAILIHAVGRALNEGAVVDDQQGRSAMVDGAGRLLMEPVKAVFTLKRSEPVRVFALDHDGRLSKPAVEIPVEKSADGVGFTLDGATHKTMYYLVEFAR